MARIRSIKPGFFTSVSNSRLPRDVRFTFAGLWTHCDDEGRCVDEPRLIKAAVWPLDDDLTAEVVDEHLSILAEAGKILRYEVDAERYIAVTKWHHQRINRPTPSQLPAPPENGS